MIDKLPDWFYPVAYFGIAILIVVALFAVGDGRTAESYRSEVRAAKELLADQKKTLPPEQEASIESALDSLDPKAIEEAER